MTQYTDTIAEGLGIADPGTSGMAAGVTSRAADAFIMSYYIDRNSRFAPVTTDGVGFTESLPRPGLGVPVYETIGFLETTLQRLSYGVINAETVGIYELVKRAFPFALDELVGVQATTQAAAAVSILEKLGLAELVAPHLTYGLTISELMQVRDELRQFFSGVVMDALGVADGIAYNGIYRPALAEGVGLTTAIDPHMVFRMLVDEAFDVTDDQLLHMTFQGLIADGVVFDAVTIEPNGTITTWAINPKNGGVTEYKNFAFNSFARMGPSKYLGASSDGLYELDGADDAGSPVIASMKSGLMQFGSMHLSTIKAIYLGIRGGGEFVLKIADGTGRETVYGLNAKNLETTRVRPGKGLRARFFSFELISTGQDFDLEAIEFIPIVEKRRG